MEEEEKCGWSGFVIGFVSGALAVAALVVNTAEAHDVHRDVVQVQGYSLCNEDERLVPIKHHGYVPERPSGWVYTCKPFEAPGKFAR